MVAYAGPIALGGRQRTEAVIPKLFRSCFRREEVVSAVTRIAESDAEVFRRDGPNPRRADQAPTQSKTLHIRHQRANRLDHNNRA